MARYGGVSRYVNTTGYGNSAGYVVSADYGGSAGAGAVGGLKTGISSTNRTQTSPRAFGSRLRKL